MLVQAWNIPPQPYLSGRRWGGVGEDSKKAKRKGFCEFSEKGG